MENQEIIEMRECPIHGLTEFIHYPSQKEGRFICKQCDSELAVLKRQKLKLKSVEYKGSKCEICGYDKNITALEFHHLDPSQKDFTIASTKCGWNEMQKELDKCILVCANCHREIHNPHATFENTYKLVEQHGLNMEVKESIHKRRREYKYKFTLEEVDAKRLEYNNWQEVADYYGISLATLKRHRKELQKQQE